MASAWGGQWIAEMMEATRALLKRSAEIQLTADQLLSLSIQLTWRVLWPLTLAGVAAAAVMLATQLAVTRLGISLKKAVPDLKRLNPMARLRELPRQNVPAFFQALVMLPLFMGAVYLVARDRLGEYLRLPLVDARSGALAVGASLQDLLWKGAALFLVFGLVDLARQKRLYSKDLRMSKQEVREELKETDGDPQIKARIRRLRRELLRRKMMSEVPKATAVIVNPTHYAVAIRYQMDSMAAPLVVAKGRNFLALRIRQKALEHQVPLIENAPLAQALYKSVQVGQEIPAHLYRAVAEILAYIYRLMNGRLPG